MCNLGQNSNEEGLEELKQRMMNVFCNLTLDKRGIDWQCVGSTFLSLSSIYKGSIVATRPVGE